MSEKRRIQFVDSRRRATFCIADGGVIELQYGNGDRDFGLCGYVDETHVNLNGRCISLHQFAKRMERNEITVLPYKGTVVINEKEQEAESYDTI